MFNGLYNISNEVLPVQNVPLEEKLRKPKDENDKTWAELNMDALEQIGRTQFNKNLKLIENYEMIKGKFIFSHYFQTEGYDSMLNQLTKDFELPNYLRHYDIISQVVNTMSGEWQKRPDVFKIKQMGEDGTNEYLRVKEELTLKFVNDKINAEIDRKLVEQGIDPAREDFESEEEMQMYSQQVQQIRQALTPPQIQKYMDADFMTVAEMWAQHQRDFNKEYYNLDEKEKVEFEDMLVADRCFRHFYTTATGYNQETWNPVNVFYHKSPDVINIEDGDYVGRVFNLSLNAIIDRYGHLLSDKDFDLLYGECKNNDKKWNDSKFNWVYDNYYVPFLGYPGYDLMRQSWGISPQSDGVPKLEEGFFEALGKDSLYTRAEGFYFVTEAYWKTQKKIFKLTYFDEDINQIVITIVDENYKIPKHFKESENIFADEHDLDTYCETLVNEVWKGVKINTSGNVRIKKDLYLKVQPNDFQFKGDANIYGCKLPVCGQIFSVRNSRSMSLVDMMKPYQIGFNVCMNQLYQLMEKEIGMFVVMDVNMFPSNKDWGGEDAWNKWMLIAKNYGLLPADTSPQNVRNSLAATGGFLPKVIDLNLAGQMVSRVNLAKFFEEQALKQVGFNQYRTGNFSAETTATGVEQGTARSYSQTESYFTNFSNYLKRCTQMDLAIAQFVQSQNDDIVFTFIKSDRSKAFIKILGTDLLLADLGVVATNSQEYVRQLEMIRQFALQNNTAGLTPVDVADVIMMNSPAAIRHQLEVSYNKILEQQQQQQQMQQQALEQQKEIAQQQMVQDAEKFQAELDNNIDVAQIKAGAQIIGSDPNVPVENDNTFANNLKYQTALNGSNLQQQRFDLDKMSKQADIALKNKELALKQAKINADLQIQNQQTESVRILKDKQMP